MTTCTLRSTDDQSSLFAGNTLTPIITLLRQFACSGTEPADDSDCAD